VRLPLRWRWQLLTLHGLSNGAIRWTIGDTLESVSNAGQLVSNLVSATRPLQNNDAFAAKVKSRPEHEPKHERYKSHEDVVTRDREASTCDGNQVIREQCFLPRVETSRFGSVVFGVRWLISVSGSAAVRHYDRTPLEESLPGRQESVQAPPTSTTA
jgi:hypothetical protein